jgi:GxxExxY protein
VHRTIGPSLLESVYAAYLCDELELAGIPFQRQVGVLPVMYKGKILPLGFRAWQRSHLWQQSPHRRLNAFPGA